MKLYSEQHNFSGFTVFGDTKKKLVCCNQVVLIHTRKYYVTNRTFQLHVLYAKICVGYLHLSHRCPLLGSCLFSYILDKQWQAKLCASATLFLHCNIRALAHGAHCLSKAVLQYLIRVLLKVLLTFELSLKAQFLLTRLF